MTLLQGLLVFIIVSIGIIVWAFCSAEEMEDHE
jgi:cbb3-type cytochrome oxidase subunit 3